MILAQIVVENSDQLMAANRQAERTLTPGSGGVADQVVEQIAADVRGAAAIRSPYQYGILSGAHRSQVFGAGQAVVFIDPTVIHPIGGGRPAVYGPILHETRPWFDWTVAQDVPAIAEKHGRKITAEVENIYG